MEGMRINLANGYDLYKSSTYDHLKELYYKKRPKKVWVSTRCTYFCNWTDLNYKHRWEELETKRRKERKMLRMITGFLLWMVEQDPTIEFYWEWPTGCRGWKEAIILHFIEKLKESNKGPWHCRLDGCRYGLKNEQEVNF